MEFVEKQKQVHASNGELGKAVKKSTVGWGPLAEGSWWVRALADTRRFAFAKHNSTARPRFLSMLLIFSVIDRLSYIFNSSSTSTPPPQVFANDILLREAFYPTRRSSSLYSRKDRRLSTCFNYDISPADFDERIASQSITISTHIRTNLL